MTANFFSNIFTAETRRRGVCAESPALSLRLCASAAKSLLCIIAIFQSTNLLHAGPPTSPPKIGGPKYGFSYSAEGALPFFITDQRHATKATPRPGFGAEFRVHLYPSTNAHIQIGMEIMSQACVFNTYYFAPGHSQFYDLNFNYTHKLRTMELYFPVMGRVGLTPGEASARNIFYVMGGYSPKIFLNAFTSISDSTGAGVWGGPTTLVYENWFISPQLGNVLIAGFGLDHRLGFSERFFSFEVIGRYNLSRFKYYGKFDTNELLLKNFCISFQFGYRFASGGRAKSLG